jgi:hypothetical protein
MDMKSTTLPLPVRGVQIDCRAQMLRFERILEILEDLARWGFNTALVEYENRFPFRGRLAGIPAGDALTRAQVRELNRVAASLGIRIIPLVHCLGHLEYVLRVPSFARFREGASGRAAATVCVSRPETRALFREMIAQVLELHPDCRWFHMGGDEAALSDDCPRCAPRVREHGVSQILVEHYIDRADWVRAQGPDPIIWCDMPLAHPEALGALRGHVTIMDWDYWSLQKPRGYANVWGLGGRDFRRPETWPRLHRELFAKRILTDDGRSARPFPYAEFLRDQGLPVILAPAARCYGDTFCAPAANHIENVIGAARSAHRARLLGSVITSWALRRSPWPLTEPTLIAGGMAMANPAVTREEMDACFAREHFNVADPALARIPQLLGAPLTAIAESCPTFEPSSGHWLGGDFEARVAAARGNPAFLAQARTLAANCRKAEALLQRARPRTARQRERVALWSWAAQSLAFYARFAPCAKRAPGQKARTDIAAIRRRAQSLQGETLRKLAPLYTDFTLVEESHARFGGLMGWIDAQVRRHHSP